MPLRRHQGGQRMGLILENWPAVILLVLTVWVILGGFGPD
jgi:hypothetical protein